jgi:uncharacterized protein YneF (UPF0154 family)
MLVTILVAVVALVVGYFVGANNPLESVKRKIKNSL